MSKKLSQNSQDPIEAAIQRAIDERNTPESKLSLFDLNFPHQSNFIADPAKRKAAWCTRRAAKSYTAGLYLCDTIDKFHEVNCLYLGLTKDHAMGIIWEDILKRINRNSSLDMDFTESKRRVTSKTNSKIYVSGAYKLIVIDEAQAFSVDLRTLVYGILGPTLIDQGGTICLMGTAGNLVQGLFYDITNGKEPGWKLHEWTAHDNPYVAKQWQEELEAIDRERPLFKQTSLFKQWYLNQWVIDDAAKVYRYEAGRNDAYALEPGLNGWHRVLAVDLAHSPDSTSFTGLAYHELSPTLFIEFSNKFPKMDITAVAEKSIELNSRFAFEVKVIDGANKQAVAELNNRHKLSFLAADKTGKSDFIKLMNDDFIQGKIKLLQDTQPLKDEYAKLIWLTDANGVVKEPRTENPVIHNDCSDGALYGWRFCHQYLFKHPLPFQDKSKQSVWEPDHIRKLEEEVRKAQNPDELEVDWAEVWEDQDDFK